MIGGWVVLGVIILIAVGSAVAQVLKNQQEPPARSRPAPARSGGGVKTGAGDIDRFLAELDKLRQKQADAGGAPPPPKPSAPPVVAKAKPKVAKPAAKPRRVPDPPTVRPASRVDALPPAVVEPLPPPPPVAARPVVTRPANNRPPQPVTPFARDLAALLANPRSVPMAVVLTEILGPPKCRQK